jgi:HlyD family secretion protein
VNFSRPPSFVLAALLLASLLACSAPATQETTASRRAPLVEAVEARFGALPVEETVSGRVRARNQVAIRPEIGGRIVEVLVRSGEAIRKGQPLVRMDDTEARERLRQAEADVRLAEASSAAARARVAELEAMVARTRALAEERLVAAQELETQEAQLAALRATADEARARVEQARATVEERRSALDKTVVRAPVGGRVGDRGAEVGMQVDPSTVLFLAGDLDALIVEVHLTEAMLARGVKPGLPVVIETRGVEGSPLQAALSRVSPFLAEQSFTALGEIDVDNRDRRLQPGMFTTVRILVGESSRATIVPLTALWEDPVTGQRGVFVVQDTAGLETPEEASTDSPEEARAVSFQSVGVLAEGRGAAGVTEIEEGAWVVTVGQHLLGGKLQAAYRSEDGPTVARVRPVPWKRVLALQDLQDDDLLEGFLDKQRKVAAALGAEIPESEDAVDRVLSEAEAAQVAKSSGE